MKDARNETFSSFFFYHEKVLIFLFERESRFV